MRHARHDAAMIIHRAFTREVLHTCGAVSAILLSIFVVVRLVGFLQQAAAGDIPVGSVFLLVLLKMVAYLDILTPLTLYISTLLVMGRWIRDNELTVLNACGVSVVQFIKPAIQLFAIVGTLAALFSLYLSPLSITVSRAITEQFRTAAGFSHIMPGVFTETRDRKSIYFVERYAQSSDTFHNLFIYSQRDAAQEVVVADSVRTIMADNKSDPRAADNFLVLQNGSRYRTTAGDTEYTVLDFQTYRLRLKPRAPSGRKLPLKARSTWDLLGTNQTAARGELHWRIAKVVMLPILLLFALSFSSITYRNARFPAMLSALLVYFVYTNALGLGLALINRGAVSAHWTLWVIHLIFLICAIGLLRRRNRNQRLMPSWTA